jgi:tRNA (cytosine38-C5)-methyltransferase
MINFKGKIRFFTPLEISRLMCFPDDFTFPKNMNVRNQYKLLGNSINVEVIKIILKYLLLNDK